jgi:uncharacterized protein YkwD
MAETKTNNLGAVQGNLTAAYNARKKRDDLYKKGYSSHPDQVKRDEYAAVGEEMDANYNRGFAEIRRLEEETRSQPIKFRALTDADRERAQKVKDIKDQIPIKTRVAQELLPKGIFRSSKIAPLQGEASVQGESPTKQVDSAEEETPTISVRKPNESGFLYKVMYAGKGGEESRVFESQKKADEALKNAGGKGAVARIALGYKPSEKKAKVFNDKYMIGKLGEPLPAEEQAARKKAYLDTFYKAKADKTMGDIRNARLKEKIKEVRKPEYKAEVKESTRLANEAKRAKDYENGAGFRSFKANVKARRESEGVLNDYNSQLSLLRSAYNQARQARQPLTALKIQRSIQRYQEGVPKEMGERQKFAESGMLKERNDMLAKKLQEAEEAEEEERKKRTLAAANSDAGDY